MQNPPHDFWVQGNSAGPYVETVDKLLLHTTEGSTIEGAIASYRARNSWPHTTVDCLKGHKYRRCGHLDMGVAARALQNDRGGVETNRDGVVQIEIVGTVFDLGAIDWDWLSRNVLLPICNTMAIPKQSTVTWVKYPDSFGDDAAQRLSLDQWRNYKGILGHQHCPENDHGDPGDIPIQTILAILNPFFPPIKEDDDMPWLIRNNQNGAAYRCAVGLVPQHIQGLGAYQAEVAVLKQINYPTTADIDTVLTWLVTAAPTFSTAPGVPDPVAVQSLKDEGDADPVTQPGA